jgi:hypothetical protein
MCLHRWLVVGVLTVAFAVVAGSAAAQGGQGQFGSNPDVFERAVLRSQDSSSSTTPAAIGPTGERWQAYAAAHSTAGSTAAQGGRYGRTPDAFERAVLRSEESMRASTDSHDRTTDAATQGYVPAFLVGVYNQSVMAKTGFTPTALAGLTERWKAYADAYQSIGADSDVGQSHGRYMPATTPAIATVDDGSDLSWRDLFYGVLLGMGLVALGGLGALAVRSHGRVPQA